MRSFGVLNDPAVRMISCMAKAWVDSQLGALVIGRVGGTFASICCLNSDSTNALENYFADRSISPDNEILGSVFQICGCACGAITMCFEHWNNADPQRVSRVDVKVYWNLRSYYHIIETKTLGVKLKGLTPVLTTSCITSLA